MAMAKRKVCIVGAGTSKLTACKHLLRYGFNPTIFEAQHHIGGVWHYTLASTHLQSPSLFYQWSDFPWPAQTSNFPPAQEVRNYIHGYAIKFELLDQIRFGCKITNVSRSDSSNSDWGDSGCAFASNPDRPTGNGAWEVTIEEKHKDQTIELVEYFDFLILSLGLLGDIPRLPPGCPPENYNGRVIHVMEYSSLSTEAARALFTNKRVVVIGFYKSVVDVAAEVAEANQGILGHPCNVIYRSVRWFRATPSNFMMNFIATRFWELCNHKPNQGLALSLLCNALFPIKWLLSKFYELYLLWNFPFAKYKMVPRNCFHEQLGGCMAPTLPPKFFDKLEKGSIKLQKSPNWKYSSKGVILDDGIEIEADVIILCTGYKGEAKLEAVIPDQFREYLKDLKPLYRGMIHPRIPQMALMGYQTDLSFLRVTDMGSKWLAHFMSGDFNLPGSHTMEKEAAAWSRHQACVTRTWHNDHLCKDLGLNPLKKSSWLHELFSPYSNLDYFHHFTKVHLD